MIYEVIINVICRYIFIINMINQPLQYQLVKMNFPLHGLRRAPIDANVSNTAQGPRDYV